MASSKTCCARCTCASDRRKSSPCSSYTVTWFSGAEPLGLNTGTNSDAPSSPGMARPMDTLADRPKWWIGSSCPDAASCPGSGASWPSKTKATLTGDGSKLRMASTGTKLNVTKLKVPSLPSSSQPFSPSPAASARGGNGGQRFECAFAMREAPLCGAFEAATPRLWTCSKCARVRTNQLPSLPSSSSSSISQPDALF